MGPPSPAPQNVSRRQTGLRALLESTVSGLAPVSGITDVQLDVG